VVPSHGLLAAIAAASALLAPACREGPAEDAAGRGGAPSAAIEGAELDVLGEVPDFAFTDQTGAPVRAADLRGRVQVASFLFTRCPTICPTSAMKLKRIGERLAGRSAAVDLVSFSVDPEHDTPEVLAAFAARYGADPARWRFLTGPPAAIRAAIEGGFKIAVDRGAALADGTPTIVHGTHYVLLDKQLRIRGYYDSDEPTRLDQLVADAIRLSRGP
jgi:protein SCO1/2